MVRVCPTVPFPVKQEKVTPKKEIKPIISSSPTKETTGKRKKKDEARHEAEGDK